MADSASIQILLNAGGNLGAVVDAATGKVLRLGKAGQGAGAAIKAETQQAGQSLASLGEQASRAFGSSGSALAKFAGPLGALGGISAVAGLTMAKALDLAREKFTALIEEPVKLAAALHEATKAADELAKARDSAISGNVGKLGGIAEPLVAQGGERMLAMARQLSTDNGLELADVSGAVQAGGQAGLTDDGIRRLVEGAKLVRQSGRMSWGDAVKAGVGNRVDGGQDATQVAADMVNREARTAFENRPMDDVVAAFDEHAAGQDAARAEHEKKRRRAYDMAQGQWNIDGQQGDRPTMGPEYQPTPFVPGVRWSPPTTAADFAGMRDNLAASPVMIAVEAQRAAKAAEADRALQDVGDRGSTVVEVETAAARIARRNPGLQKYAEEDAKLSAQQSAAETKAKAWDFLGPFNGEWGEVKKIADERKRKTNAFQIANPAGIAGVAETSSVESFLAKGDAERAKLEEARKAQGLPFGAGILNVRIINADEIKAPAPLVPAQVGE